MKFTLIKDRKLPETERWKLVKPSGSRCSLLLAKANNSEQISRIGIPNSQSLYTFRPSSNSIDYT